MDIKHILTTVICVVVGVWVVFRLPQNGWASLVWFSQNVMFRVIRAPYQAMYERNTIVDNRITLADRILLPIGLAVTTVLPAFYLMFGFLTFADFVLPGWIIVIGTLLGIAGLYMI